MTSYRLTSKYLRVNKEEERVTKKSILLEHPKQKKKQCVFYLRIKKKSDQEKTWVVVTHHQCRLSPVIPLMSLCTEVISTMVLVVW